jgi:hypothetical protein
LGAYVKRHQPYNPCHPIRGPGGIAARPLLRPRVRAPEVTDPDGKIIPAPRQTADQMDHLGSLHSRRHIDDGQFKAGRLYQRDTEIAERGLQALDTTRQRVDGGSPAEPISDGRRKAQERLTGANAAMGLDGSALARDALIGGLCMGAIALKRDDMYRLPSGEFKLSGGLHTPTEIARNRFGRPHILKLGIILNSALDCLAIYYGLATPSWN